MAWSSGDIRLTDALSRMADLAKANARPPPVIETDRHSACLLAQLIARCLVYPVPRAPVGADYVAMFDGVKIVARRPETGQHEVDGWREHFGPLADIWESI